MTAWDLRVLLRALGATAVAFLVVWLVTAASDEGQLTAGARAGRTLPVAPLCSAVGAALALGSSRVRHETRALEALGRSPAQISTAAALGAALPSLAIAALIALSPRVDVSAFYPRAATAETFVFQGDGFVSTSLGIRVDAMGESYAIEAGELGPDPDRALPRGARAAAAAATALAGAALALIASRAVVRPSLRRRNTQQRRQLFAVLQALACAVLTLVAFQAAAVGMTPSAVAVVPPLVLLAVALFGYRRHHELAT